MLGYHQQREKAQAVAQRLANTQGTQQQRQQGPGDGQQQAVEVEAALGQAKQAPAGQVDQDRALHQAAGGSRRVIDMAQVQVQHRYCSNGKDQAHGQRTQPGLLGQQPQGAGQPAGKGYGKTGQGDFYALTIKAQVDHVTQNGPQ